MTFVEAVTQASGLEGLREEWQQLMSDCPTATAFQSYEWITTWWRFFGQGSPGKRLFVVTVRDEARKLIALAPFMTSFWYGMPVRRLSFIGEGASDYHDVLAMPGTEETACQAIYRYLAQAGGWQIGDLNQLREGGLLRKLSPFEESGIRFTDYPQEACPYLPYPTTPDPAEKWNALLLGLGKKMRYNVGYYERLLRRTHEVEIGAATAADEVDEALTALFELHRRRWNQRWLPGVFSSRRVQAFHRAVASLFMERDWLRLHTLRLDGEIQAVLYCFKGHDRTCYYQAGFEPTLAKLSLGTVLTAHAIQTSIREGKTEFDFLRGNEPYKERWTGNHARMNVRRLIARGQPGLAVGGCVRRLENAVETRFKNWMHHRFAKKSTVPEPPR